MDNTVTPRECDVRHEAIGIELKDIKATLGGLAARGDKMYLAVIGLLGGLVINIIVTFFR